MQFDAFVFSAESLTGYMTMNKQKKKKKIIIFIYIHDRQIASEKKVIVYLHRAWGLKRGDVNTNNLLQIYGQFYY